MISSISFFTNLPTDSTPYKRLHKLLANKSKKFINSSKVENLAQNFLKSSCDVLIVGCDSFDNALYKELSKIRQNTPLAPFISIGVEQSRVDSKKLMLFLNLGSFFVLSEDFKIDELKRVLLQSLKPINSINSIKKKAKEMSESKNECERVLNIIPPMVVTIKNGELVQANKRFLSFFGCEDVESFKKKHDSFEMIFIPLKGYFFSNDSRSDWISQLLERPEGYRKCILKGVDEEACKFVIHLVNADSSGSGTILTFSDITAEENMLLEKIKEYEIANSPKLNSWKIVRENLSVEIHRSKRYGGVFSLVLFCISDEKNSTIKLDRMGDSTFGVVEKIAKNTIRPTDILSKWETNRYFVICYKTDRDGAIKFANRLISEMRKNHIIIQNRYNFKISCATYQDNDNQNLMLKRAMNGLNKAIKESGDSIISDIETKKSNSTFGDIL